MGLRVEEALAQPAFWRAAFRHGVYPSTLLTAVAVSQSAMAALNQALHGLKGDPVCGRAYFSSPQRNSFYAESVRATFHLIELDPQGNLQRWLDVATEEAVLDPAFWLAVFDERNLKLILEPHLLALIWREPTIQTAIFDATMVADESTAVG